MLRRSLEPVSKMLTRKRHQSSLEMRDLFTTKESAESGAFEVYRCEGGDDLAPPQVIVAEAADAEDLFAIVAAYYPTASPITAFSHVVDGDARSLLRGSSKASKRKSGSDFDPLIKALLGASIGEALLDPSKSNESAVAYSACRQSLAFCLARYVAVYKGGDRLDLISRRWTSLRKMSRLSVPKHLSDALLVLCGLFEGIDTPDVLDGLDQDGPMRFLVGTLSGDESASAEFRRALEASYRGLDSYFLGLRGSFDGRLSAFTEIASRVADGPGTQLLKDVSVAYACDQILPGSFSHPGVLQKIVDKFPAALVWYGAFAAGAHKSNEHKIQSILDKLMRDSIEAFSFEHRPQCDISFTEFEVVSRAGLRANSLRPGQVMGLCVALVPGVNIYTAPLAEADSPDAALNDHRRNAAVKEAARLLDQAARLLSGEGPRTSSFSSRFRK